MIGVDGNNWFYLEGDNIQTGWSKFALTLGELRSQLRKSGKDADFLVEWEDSATPSDYREEVAAKKAAIPKSNNFTQGKGIINLMNIEQEESLSNSLPIPEDYQITADDVRHWTQNSYAYDWFAEVLNEKYDDARSDCLGVLFHKKYGNKVGEK